MKLILGSSSRWRAQILREAGYAFDILSPNIDEKAIRHSDPKTLALALAHAKADALREKLTEPALLITSDEVVVCDGKMREKPSSEEEARAFLASYVDHPAETVTAVVVTNTPNGKRVEGIDIAKVFFDPIPEEAVSRILAAGDVYHCAGGFMTDGLFAPFVRRIEGTPDSIAGLPLALTKRLLQELSP